MFYQLFSAPESSTVTIHEVQLRVLRQLRNIICGRFQAQKLTQALKLHLHRQLQQVVTTMLINIHKGYSVVKLPSRI
jgi:hypothetical protein